MTFCDLFCLPLIGPLTALTGPGFPFFLSHEKQEINLTNEYLYRSLRLHFFTKNKSINRLFSKKKPSFFICYQSTFFLTFSNNILQLFQSILAISTLRLQFFLPPTSFHFSHQPPLTTNHPPPTTKLLGPEPPALVNEGLSHCPALGTEYYCMQSTL